MKRDTLKQFEELEDLVKQEVKDIAKKILLESETFLEAIQTLSDFYKSEYKLDDYIYSEIHKEMKKQTIKKR